MTTHNATVEWQLVDGEFRKGRFSRAHSWHFDAGFSVPASASPAVIPPPWSERAAIDPEEAFVAALASCHMMSFLYLANQRGIKVLSYRDEACGTLGRRGSGKAITEVTLRPCVTYAPDQQPERAVEQALHAEAHELCFIANSVTSEIRIEPGGAGAASSE